MKTHISIRLNKITEQQIAELRERFDLQQTEVITMAVDKFYQTKMEDGMINFEEFCEWHNPDNTISEDKLREAYEVYKSLFVDGNKDFADDKICGHPVWDNK